MAAPSATTLTTAPAATSGKARVWFALALVVGLAARAPGVFWGDDFPAGFRAHHVDEWTQIVHTEMLINPQVPPRWKPQAYPLGTPAHVAVPMMVERALEHRLLDPALPPVRRMVLLGRGISVAYGVLTLVVLWFLTRRLTGSEAVASLAAWILALGGLHVTQSHFFLADVPALFWFLLGTHLLLVDRDTQGARPLALTGAAFAMGAAVGIKLFVAGLPILAIVMIAGRPRIGRAVQTACAGIAGFVLVTMAAFTPFDIWKAIVGDSISPPDQLDWHDFPRLYGIELLPSFGAAATLAALCGGLALLWHALTTRWTVRRLWIMLIVVAPLALHAVLVLFKLAPFPRHLLPFFPGLAILAAIALRAATLALTQRGKPGAWVVAVVLGWQALVVIDAERGFLADTRVQAFTWIREHAAPGATIWWPAYEGEMKALGHENLKFPELGTPRYLVAEAYRVNHFLSGTGLRDSHPTDHRRVFDGESQMKVAAWQHVVDGSAGYAPDVQFVLPRFMPESMLADRLLGNRSRTYLGDITIFELR